MSLNKTTPLVTVVIGADICPIGANAPLFQAGDAPKLLNDLLPEFAAADLSVANLECPFIEERTPILKTGPVFGVAGECINGIREAGIDVLSLANNHILDHGPNGLRNTLRVCAQAGIETVGAGENLNAARQMLIREVKGIRIAILSVAEHEFSIAGKNSWGANPLDPIDFVRNVKSRKDSFDYLIVLLHGGDEFHVPSPRLKDTCHFMIEMGANAVIVQHSHCLGGCEDYLGGHIVYGQGALLMDEEIYRDLGSFHEGFLVKLLIAPDATSRMDLVPFSQSNPEPGARKLHGEQELRFRRMLEEKSAGVKDDAVVAEQWLAFCERGRHDYLSSLLAHNRVLNRLNRSGLLEKYLHGKLPLLRARNIVCCETHREVIETLFDRHRL